MALLTHKVSSCTDNYSLFTKEKHFYGIPYLDRSRSSIPSDASSFFSGALSLRESNQDLSHTPPRNVKSSSSRLTSPNIDAQVPRTVEDAETTASHIVELGCQLDTNGVPLPDFEEDAVEDAPWDSTDPPSPPDNASFVTANSANIPTITVKEVGDQERNPYVFHKWMKTMFRKSPKYLSPDTANAGGECISLRSCRTGRSSSGFVSAVKTASITLASFPLSGHSTSRRSSSGFLDPATIARMLDRKHALEELITTEEYYIRDLRSLKDKYLPILRDCVWISSDVRQTMARNVTEMLELHGRLLADITRALPCTAQMIQDHGLDAGKNLGDVTAYPILADPAAAAEVARAFDKTIMAFFVYEEYSAKYQEVLKAPKRAGRSSDNLHGKGTEALIGASNSWDNRGDYGKRAMELYDLLFKPIQRLCKYPLLFREIEKHTPAIDCPDTNRLLEKVRHRLDEAVHQVNVANSDAPRMRERIEKTWLLQDRLDFHEKSLPVRLLGHVILCGTLHVTWQSTRETQPHTEYMACLLFKSYLILASVAKADHYKVKFAITLAVARIEQPNHGKGLYSPGAPHTWKLVFEADHHIFEVLLSACSDDEEFIWRNHIDDRILAEHKDYQEYSSTNMDFCSCRSSDIKPVADVFGRPGTLARHQSLVRGGSSSTLESDGQYVVINNFLFADDANGSTNLRRSYSALNFNGLVPTINLKRAERNRVEGRLADVWTRDLIPFNATRSKPHKEPSGTMIMRRLSMLSLLSGGARKSILGIYNDVSDTTWEEDYDFGESTIRRSSTLSFARTKSTSYHTAPSSPTKRSSSLSSRFSFNSSVKKENLSEKPSPVSKRRSIMPLLDGKWRATDDAIVEATAAELHEATQPGPWGREEGYFSIAKPTTPPNSIQEEELSIHAALDDDYMKLKAGGNEPTHKLADAGKPTTEPKMSRRHTIMASPRARPRPWKSVKRHKALSEPLFSTKLSGSSALRSDR
ncbi:hypothetical protein FN846DRAFT_416655 [Sphaerosporella brunnea]|uniref:DH domain-containing protein n=1 Tax=Sphaerosporella brunnea TaxID=1250544 RepID=A0A5J5EHF0_9PEZI|nr:hypothetical protein FN846DRAFT_416655 [Sphaerosporella brunnea]